MDFNLKQWRHDSEEEEEGPPSLKLPKIEPYSNNSQYQTELPLFVPQTTTNNLSSYDHIQNTTKFQTRIGSCFNLAQWQELELQALIYRHMIAGAPVPQELLHLVNKSLITSPCYLSQSLQQIYYPHYQPALVQSGYWGRAAMDPEPGRCRRTDGKKWRCSRDVVTGQKYCERHVHRGRNRSRKHVEIATNNTNAGDSIKSVTNTTTSSSNEVVPHFTLSGLSPSSDLLQLSGRPSDSIIDTKSPFEAQDSGGRTLRRFFDDWPRSLHEGDSTTNTATNLSISMPGNPSSDFSLKLGTGDGEESGTRGERERPDMNWATTWEAHPAAPMGGPLAEALRSSTSNSSPTSVLHRLSRGSISEASYVST